MIGQLLQGENVCFKVSQKHFDSFSEASFSEVVLKTKDIPFKKKCRLWGTKGQAEQALEKDSSGKKTLLATEMDS